AASTAWTSAVIFATRSAVPLPGEVVVAAAPPAAGCCVWARTGASPTAARITAEAMMRIFLTPGRVVGEAWRARQASETHQILCADCTQNGRIRSQPVFSLAISMIIIALNRAI